jgi:hypothetical protein
VSRSLRKGFRDFSLIVGAEVVAPSAKTIQMILFCFGVGLLFTGLLHPSYAARYPLDYYAPPDIGDHGISYNDTQIAQAVVAILTYIEGSFGALVMVTAGIAAILGAAFGQYRAALGCLVVAVGAFILRSVMSTFFNTQGIDETAQ